MTLQEPRGDEIHEEELQRLGIQKGEKKLEKKILLISGFDEWYGPIYTCPYCTEEKIMDNFNFCPACGGNMSGYGFETIAEEQKKDGERKTEKDGERK